MGHDQLVFHDSLSSEDRTLTAYAWVRFQSCYGSRSAVCFPFFSFLKGSIYCSYSGASQVVLVVKNPPANAGETLEVQVRSLGGDDPLEEGMAIHSGILVWKFPWTEEPGELRPWGCKELDMTKQLSLSLLLQLLYPCSTVVHGVSECR